MKRSIFILSCMLIAAVMIAPAFSQKKECPMMKGKGMCKFESMDANKDGKISKEEWTNFHNKMFDDADKSKDGAIDKTEMQEHHKKMMEEKHEMMKGK